MEPKARRVFGGNLSLMVRDASKVNTLNIGAAGTPTRSWKAASTSIETDSTDVFLQLSRKISDHTKIYGIGEGFFNTSLGMALQQSYGLGLSYSIPFPSAPKANSSWTYGGAIDARYFGERLYNIPRPLRLAGIRMDQQFTYRFKAEPDRLKADKYALTGHVWLNEMLNDQRAVQGYAGLNFSFPIWRSVCFSISEEDNYLNNVPAGFDATI